MHIRLLSCCLFITQICSAQKAAAILEQTAQAFAAHNSMRYDMLYTFKGSDRKDTVLIRTNMQLLKDSTNKGFGAEFVLRMECIKGKTYDQWMDHKWMFCGKEGVYLMNTLAREATHSRIDTMSAPTTAVHVYGQFFREFAKPSLFRYYADSCTIVKKKDAKINGKKYFVVSVTMPATSMFPEQLIYYIDKETLLPIARERIIRNGETPQYTKQSFLSYSFDDVAPEAFSTRQISYEYKIRELAPQQID